jgi:hypothetical protein
MSIKTTRHYTSLGSRGQLGLAYVDDGTLPTVQSMALTDFAAGLHSAHTQRPPTRYGHRAPATALEVRHGRSNMHVARCLAEGEPAALVQTSSGSTALPTQTGCPQHDRSAMSFEPLPAMLDNGVLPYDVNNDCIVPKQKPRMRKASLAGEGPDTALSLRRVRERPQLLLRPPQ